jgi:hypothetical protein
MKAEHNSIMSGSAAAVILGITITIIPWFFPISIWTKIILSIIGIVIFLLGLANSKG